ncbi:hypothetical protein NicSoilB4_24820 [Arthrobacter sp. NicSoilB4]|nr:hypothetical protein NicSoilB4_24820 [Arthrobacter sp. NicSoilB4]
MLSPDLQDNPGTSDHKVPARRRRLAPVSTGTTAPQWLCIGLVASLVVLAVFMLRAAGGLTGWRYGIALGLVLILIPTSRTFSQRILFSIVGLAGTAPIMWWVTGPVPDLNRGSVVLAVAAAALAGSACYWRVKRQPLRTFLPHLRAVDGLPVLAGLASLWVVQSFVTVRTPEQALLLLTRSWDFAPHFNMFNMIRNHGSVIAVLPASPDGGPWSAATYPQGFHSLAATFAEVVAGSTAGDAGQEVLLFCRLVGVISVLGTLLVVAGLTSLPVLRHNFFVTLPLVAIVSTAWVVGPGAIPVFGAFPNFGLGVALCVACIAIVQLRRVIHPALASTALILALIGVAHGWILLLVLCLPSAVVYGWHLFRHRAQLGRPLIAIHSLLALLGAAALVAAVWQLHGMSAGEVLTTNGGIALADTGVAVLCIIANAFVALAFYSRRRVGTDEVRLGTLTSLHVLATPLYAAALLVCLAVFQLVQAGMVTYYFHKSFLAVEIVAIVCTVIGAAELWSPLLLARSHRKAFLAASLLTSLGATQFFGLPFTGLSQQGMKPTASGPTALLQQSTALADPMPPLIPKLLAVSRVEQRRPFIYVGFNDFFDPLLAAQWSLTLQGKWTNKIEPAIPMVSPLYKGPSKVPDSIVVILETMPDLDVMVDAVLVPELRAALPQYASRIITY